MKPSAYWVSRMSEKRQEREEEKLLEELESEIRARLGHSSILTLIE